MLKSRASSATPRNKKKKRKRVGGNGQLLANSAEALMALIFLTQKRLASQLKTIIVHCLSTM